MRSLPRVLAASVAFLVLTGFPLPELLAQNLPHAGSPPAARLISNETTVEGRHAPGDLFDQLFGGLVLESESDPASGSIGETVSEASPLSIEDQIRWAKIAHCRAVYFRKQVDANVLRPWSIMHGLIGSGIDTQVVRNGMRVNAADYLCENGPGDGMQILYLEQGKVATRQGPGVQGHAGQLLAILAQSGVNLDHSMTIEGKRFTVADLLKYEQDTIRSGTELTFKLIAFTYYLPPTATWVNDAGETWTMERLVREEANEPVSTGACGGVHRLMALSHAVANRIAHGEQLDGQWLRADAIVHAYMAKARQLQNTDGSFSTDFFEGRGNDFDMTRRLYTTGHILEWMAFTLPPEYLKDRRITAAVDYLVDAMLAAPDYDIDVGPRGHSLHALALYEAKVFGANSSQLDLITSRERFESLRELHPEAFGREFTWSETRQAQKGPTDDASSSNQNRLRRSSGVFRRR